MLLNACVSCDRPSVAALCPSCRGIPEPEATHAPATPEQRAARIAECRRAVAEALARRDADVHQRERATGWQP